jgi:hypothetical protein
MNDERHPGQHSKVAFVVLPRGRTARGLSTSWRFGRSHPARRDGGIGPLRR